MAQVNKSVSSNPSVKKQMADAMTEYANGKKGAAKISSGGATHSATVLIQNPEAELEKLISALKSHVIAVASSYGLPESVINDIKSLDVVKKSVKQSTNGVSVSFDADVTLSFTNSLSRPSLNPNNKKGAYNIVGIFNEGVDYDGPGVWGMWRGKRVHSLGYRPPLHFLEEAIRTFDAESIVPGATIHISFDGM